MAARAKTKKTAKKRAQRATSNVFAMFDQNQIQEFKEAFNMIDQNHDGFVDKEDLHDMLASLGKDPSDDYVLRRDDAAIAWTDQLYHVSYTVRGEIERDGPRGRDLQRVCLF